MNRKLIVAAEILAFILLALLFLYLNNEQRKGQQEEVPTPDPYSQTNEAIPFTGDVSLLAKNMAVSECIGQRPDFSEVLGALPGSYITVAFRQRDKDTNEVIPDTEIEFPIGEVFGLTVWEGCRYQFDILDPAAMPPPPAPPPYYEDAEGSI